MEQVSLQHRLSLTRVGVSSRVQLSFHWIKISTDDWQHCSFYPSGKFIDVNYHWWHIIFFFIGFHSHIINMNSCPLLDCGRSVVQYTLCEFLYNIDLNNRQSSYMTSVAWTRVWWLVLQISSCASSVQHWPFASRAGNEAQFIVIQPTKSSVRSYFSCRVVTIIFLLILRNFPPIILHSV